MLIYYSVIINFKYVWAIGNQIYSNKTPFSFNIIFNSLGLIFIYTLDVVGMFVLTMFFKFHLKLVYENKTTIETIEKKSQDFESSYNIGKNNNFEQVMGTNKFLWFIPYGSFSGQPIGNGMDWTLT